MRNNILYAYQPVAHKPNVTMKLQNVITFRLSILKAVSIVAWAVCFYLAATNEINEETDESLTAYAETLVTDYLAGEQLPDSSTTLGDKYTIRKVSAEYATKHRHIRYKDTETYFNSSYDYEPARAVAYIFQTDDGQYRELTVFTTTIDKDKLKRSILYWLIVLYAVLLVGITAVNIWTVSHSMRPLKRLFKWLDDYKLGQKNRPLDNNTDITEFKRLNETVTRNLERGERQYEQQKLFIANASHEMQTPLAVCVNRLEMLLDDEALTEGQMEEIIKTMHTLKNLSDVNRSLLLLCKIDNHQFNNRTKVSIKGIVERTLPDLENIYAGKRITVMRSVDDDTVANMDSLLADTLVANLLKNAFIHNTGGGRITVATGSDTLTIANTGSPEPLDENRIFECFYHSADKKSSTGLGLAIVKAVCNLYGFGIKYSFEGGMHVFKVTFYQK